MLTGRTARVLFHTCFRGSLPAAVILLVATIPARAEVSIHESAGKATVTIGGELFAEYVYEGHSKPIVYPIIGPYGIEMTRHYPMRKDVDNEASDHPHHKSLWFTHDDVNGVRFWMEYTENDSDVRPGRIQQTALKVKGNTIETRNDWVSPEGDVICTDHRELTFGTTEVGRYIDVSITIHASHGDLTFGDTKEGTMGIRTHPLLRLKTAENRGNHTAAGKAVNSEGVEGAAIWGKRAQWVDYWAPINDTTVGIAIFDHPQNPRHPTWWHAREYGLIAANPFGVHDFEGKPAGTGDMHIPADEQRRFRYRFLFHRGDVEEADIPGQYAAFADRE